MITDKANHTCWCSDTLSALCLGFRTELFTRALPGLCGVLIARLVYERSGPRADTRKPDRWAACFVVCEMVIVARSS